MARLFQVTAPCALFAPQDGDGSTRLVSFQRGAMALNSAGETVLSYASSVQVTGEWQPMGGGYGRFIHGLVTQIDAVFYALGNTDIRVGDRCTDPSAGNQSARMEVVNLQPYGLEHTEIALQQLGR